MSKREVEELIRRIVVEEGLTCLVVTHDLVQTARMASRVMVLKAGRLERVGSPTEVIDAESHFR